MIANHSVVLLRRVIFTLENPNVVDAQLVGHDHHAPTLHPHRRRLFVITPVADIFESLGG